MKRGLLLRFQMWAWASRLRAALVGASLNVFINTRLMRDREKAEALNARAQGMLTSHVPLADRVSAAVQLRLTTPREG